MALPNGFICSGPPKADFWLRPYLDDPARLKVLPQELRSIDTAPLLSPSINSMFQQYGTSYAPTVSAPMAPQPSPQQHQEWQQGLTTSRVRIDDKNVYSGASEPCPTGVGHQADTRPCAGGKTGNTAGAVNLDVDFPGLVVSRKSKALKLISPSTNAPISPEREGMPGTSDRDQDWSNVEVLAIPNSKVGRPRNGLACGDDVVGRGKALKETARVSQVIVTAGSSKDGGPISPTSGLPIGSKLRRWMVSPRPGSSIASSVDSGIDGSDQGGAEDGLNPAERKPHDDRLAPNSVKAAECDNNFNDRSINFQRETAGESQCSESSQQTVIDSADALKGTKLSAKRGVVKADGEGMSVVMKSTEMDTVLAGEGSRGHSQASGIPRSSRLHMWMGQSEG